MRQTCLLPGFVKVFLVFQAGRVALKCQNVKALYPCLRIAQFKGKACPRGVLKSPLKRYPLFECLGRGVEGKAKTAQQLRLDRHG
jgi:hypothetical protein